LPISFRKKKKICSC